MAHTQDDQANDEGKPAGLTAEELAERMAEARVVFEQFDADGSGSIDSHELRDALDASDMDVSEEVHYFFSVSFFFWCPRTLR